MVAEEKLEAFPILSGMRPTYRWFQLQALREVAAQCDLCETDIVLTLKRIACRPARTLFESGLSPAEVIDLIPIKPLSEDQPAIRNLTRPIEQLRAALKTYFPQALDRAGEDLATVLAATFLDKWPGSPPGC